VSGVPWNGTPRASQRLHRLVDVVRAERDVLDAFALIDVQVFLDSATCRPRIVDRKYESCRPGWSWRAISGRQLSSMSK